MKRLQDEPIYLHLFFFFVIAVVLLGCYMPGLWCASSVTEAFLYAVGSEHPTVGGLCLGYAIVAPVLLVFFYVLFVVQKRAVFLKIFMVTDIAVSLLFRVMLVCRGMELFDDLIVGFALRVLYFVCGFYKFKSATEQ